jgi:hypothetical protein
VVAKRRPVLVITAAWWVWPWVSTPAMTRRLLVPVACVDVVRPGRRIGSRQGQPVGVSEKSGQTSPGDVTNHSHCEKWLSGHECRSDGVISRLGPL